MNNLHEDWSLDLWIPFTVRCGKHTSPVPAHLPGGGGVEGESLKAASLMYTE